MLNTFFLPTDASFADDIKVSLNLLKPLNMLGAKTGLMFIIKDGIKGLQNEAKNVQLKNIQKIIKNDTTPFIVMVSNKIEDLDFYHKPDFSNQHIKEAINFSLELPSSLSPIVSFHLNTLFTKEEWIESGETLNKKFIYWKQKFLNKVWPGLKKISEYAKEKNIPLKIETTPVPEFGDLEKKELNTLVNPYPVYSKRGMNEIRNTGIGIVLDLCHTYTLYKAISLLNKNDKLHNVYKGLFSFDFKSLKDKNLIQEVNSLKDNDIIHINDSKNIFNPQEKTYHQEGISLGKGEINELPEIIKKIKNLKVNIVFEINEIDFQKRPNTKASIDYFLKYYK